VIKRTLALSLLFLLPTHAKDVGQWGSNVGPEMRAWFNGVYNRKGLSAAFLGIILRQITLSTLSRCPHYVRFFNRPFRVSTFRLSAAAVSMSLTGSRTSQHYRKVAKLGRGIQKTQWMGRVENLIGAARVRYPHRQPSQTSMGPGRE
jgi:hypothetical protein